MNETIYIGTDTKLTGMRILCLNVYHCCDYHESRGHIFMFGTAFSWNTFSLRKIRYRLVIHES